MDEAEIDIRSIFGVLRRQMRLIIATVIIIVAISGMATFALTPIYSASALVLVDTSNKNLLDPQMQMGTTSADNARVDSEVEIMRSDSLLLRVISSQSLLGDPEFGVTAGDNSIFNILRQRNAELPTGEQAVNQVLGKLRGAVTIQRRGLTYLINVQVRSTRPKTAANLANALADAYIEEQVQSKIGAVTAARDVLQAQIDAGRQALISSEDAFDDFIDANIARITEESGGTGLASVRRQIDELSTARQQAETTINTVQQNLESSDWQVVVATLQSDALEELERQRVDALNRLSGVDESSPTAIDLRAELDAIQTSLRQTAEGELTNLRSQIQETQDQEQGLRVQLRSQVLNSSLSSDVLTQIYELQQNAELARVQYQTLLSRTQELDTQASLQVADSRIVSPALPPQAAAFPNKRIIVLVAGMLALGLGIVLAFLYENLIGGFTSDEQLESVTKAKVASSIPRLKEAPSQRSVADNVVSAPLSPYSESIRRVRVALDQQLRKDIARTGGAVVMVTSTAPSEGKTTTALALARSFALSGRRTLIVDCDLRRPSLHRHLGLEPSVGLQEFLSNQEVGSVDVSSVVTNDEMSSVTVIIGSRRSGLPTDQLLSSEAFSRLIDACRRTFDVVILDTPPLGPVVDGFYIAPYADLAVFIARWASTSQSEARKAIDGLKSAMRPGTEVFAVLNQQNESKSTYMRKYGGYYSDAY